MSSAGPFNLSVVYEFAGEPDHMMHSLLEGLRPTVPGMRVTFIPGIFSKYRPGGLRPGRLANLVWVYLRVAVHLVIRRPDAVIVQSTPPGIQLWTVAWAALRGAPVICWLMDYHPEFEARMLEREKHIILARLLRAVDAALMPRFTGIITLDPAMAALVRAKAKDAAVLEHPTWIAETTTKVERLSYGPAESNGSLRLAYSGNLGAAHDLEPLRRLIESVTQRRHVQLFVIGGSPMGEQRFRRMCVELDIEVEFIPRAPRFSDLRDIYEKLRIDAGIVLLSEESAGVVSPSKFSAYIIFGLPIVYIGPPGTNAASVCLKFQGGFWMPTGSSPTDTKVIADRLIDRRQMAAAADGAHAAAQHFAQFNGSTLAAKLAPLLVLGIAGSMEVAGTGVRGSQRSGGYRLSRVKRAFDILFSLVGLVVLSPFLLIICVLVRLKLGSPILFAQQRPGLGGRIFTIWKFRTMTGDRDASGNLLPDAARLTRFGQFLRTTSLDELPELWNVLRADMSLVGPRPLLVSYLSRYSTEQARRHHVRPGVTGWAQINGRNATTWEDRLRFDVWYVDNRTLGLDLHILLRTVTIVLRREGVSSADSVTMPEFSPSHRVPEHGKPSTPRNALQ
jgi:sugar transferase EpsL